MSDVQNQTSDVYGDIRLCGFYVTVKDLYKNKNVSSVSLCMCECECVCGASN